MSGRDYTITSSQLASGWQSRSRPIFQPGQAFLACADPQPKWGTAHATRRCGRRTRPWLGCVGRPGPAAGEAFHLVDPSFEDALKLRRACSPAHKPAESPRGQVLTDRAMNRRRAGGPPRVHVCPVQRAGPRHCHTHTPTSSGDRHRCGTWCFRVRPGPARSPGRDPRSHSRSATARLRGHRPRSGPGLGLFPSRCVNPYELKSSSVVTCSARARSS